MAGVNTVVATGPAKKSQNKTELVEDTAEGADCKGVRCRGAGCSSSGGGNRSVVRTRATNIFLFNLRHLHVLNYDLPGSSNYAEERQGLNLIIFEKYF